MSNSQLVANRRRELKRMIVEYMGGECRRCGFSGHQSALVPHHVDPKSKSFGLGNGCTYSWIKIQAECKKCVLLCQNCHSEVHALNEKKWFDKNIIPDYNELFDKKALGKQYQRYCTDCMTEISFKALRCKSCAGKMNGRVQVDWPSVELVQALVKENGYAGAARILNVSDNGIRKFLKRNNAG